MKREVKIKNLMVLLLLTMSVSSAFGVDSYFYARLTAKPANQGEGLVYVKDTIKNTSSATINENLYTNTSRFAQGPSKKGAYETDFNFYIYAKPVREYEFKEWSIAGCVENSKSGHNLKITKIPKYTKTTQNNLQVTTDGKQNKTIAGAGKEADYQEVTATAKFTQLTPFEVVYKEAAAPYTVDYTYSKLISDIQMQTKVWESYSVYAENTSVRTYKGDKVTLSTSVKDGFQGWFMKEGDEEKSVSSATEYTKAITPEAAATYYPKWEASSGNVALVNGTPYTSLESAITAANNTEGDVNVKLLQYIFYSGSTALDLTRSMTIDLNGKNLYGLDGCLFRIANDAEVTLKDGATSKGKILVMDANAGQMQTIDVYQGTLINNGASIQIENKLAENEITPNIITSAVYVQANGAFTNNSGTVTTTSVANAYGIYSQGTTSISGGTITAKATTNVAYGIYATKGNVTVNGGTINTNAAMSSCGVVTDGNAQGSAASATIETTTITAKASVQNAAAVRVIDGTITVNGGTYNVNTPTGAYGAASGAETIVKRKGYPNNGQLIINGGTFTTTANTSSGTGFAIFVNPSITLPGTDGYVSTTVTGGKFKTTGKVKGVTNSTAAGVQISGGMYNVAIQALNHIKVGYYSKTMASGDAGYSEGYRYQVVEGENTQSVCRIVEVDGLEFSTLEAALGYASNHPEAPSLRILMLKPYYMSKPGIYTLPSNAGLLLPYQESQTDYYNLETNYETEYEAPSMYMQLTLGGGVQLNVSGKIEVGGRQFIAGAGVSGAGVPTGTYGQLHLEPGCKITLLNGARLNAWGFVTGKGEIDARSGSEVHEQFQMMDWKGGSISSVMLKSQNTNGPKVFPVSQYFIQNVEAPTTFHPGSALWAITGVRVTAPIQGALTPRADVQIIGKDAENEAERDVALFLMNPAHDQDNTWVRKYYDAEHDLQVYEVNSAASLGSMTINISEYVMNSKDYILPITNNLKIHLLSGEMGITQSTVLLPGAEIEIDKTATVTINSNQAIYLYDIQQWDKYIFNNVYAHRLKYSPAFNGAPSDVQRKIVNANGSAALRSATINVHGTLDVKGNIFTTTGGANIYSTVADAGTVKFSADAVAEGSVYQPDKSYKVAYITVAGKQVPEELENGYVAASCTSAQLKNEDGSYQSTVGTKSGKSFCFIDMNDGLGGRWTSLRTEGCFVLDEATGIYYAKPSDYVALKNGKTANADHTYSSADGTRTFILICNNEQTDCQWWEVTYHEESGLYYCDKNNKYYFFDEEGGEWVVKTYEIYWFDWDGTPLTDEHGDVISYTLPYGAMPVFNSSKPVTRPKETYYTYDFAGWEPELAPVTGDASYTAKYDRKDVMFTITFNWTENEVAKTNKDFLTANTMPTPPDGIDMTNKEWRPALSYVTGDAIYVLQDKDPEKTTYTITYKNKNGDVLKKANGTDDAIYQSGSIDVNGEATRTNYDGADPTINPADIPADMNMVWDTENPWLPALTDKISSDMVYVAQYKSTPKTYTITWNWMDGEDAEHSTVRTTENVAYMAVPQYTNETPTKQSDASYHYTFSGWNTRKDGNGSSEIEAATSDKTYYAQYDLTYIDKKVTTEETIEEDTQLTATNLTITSTGTLTIPNTSCVNATNLILKATSEESGQLLGSNVSAVNAYFDLTLNTAARHWHAFGVPWAVDLNTNPLIEVETGRTLTLGSHYEIVYYDTHTRANEGPGAHCWKYLKHYNQLSQPIDLLTPGKGYMIAFTSAVQTVRFVKKSGEPILFNGTVNVTAEGEGADKGINAIANPMAYHATMAAGPAVGYVHDGGEIGSDGYDEYDINGKSFIVGKAVYVQVNNTHTVTVNPSSAAPISPIAAPARRTAKATDKEYLSLSDYYHVSIASETTKGGSVYVLPEEDKEDQYVIGHDLSKFGMSTKKPQIWIKRYDVNLGLNTTAPINDVAEFPVNLYAPAAGEYTLSLVAQPDDDYIVYLTLNGEAIWNLSDGAYTLSLAAGTNKSYGLRLSARKAPQTATGIDEAIIDAQGETKKVLINNQVFIIRGENVYTIDGQMVK